MSKPIILHITTGLQVGGAERFLVNLLAEFQNSSLNQFEHRVAYFRPGPYLVELERLGIKCYAITGLLQAYDLIGLGRLFKLIYLLRPKYLHSQLWVANLYTRLVGKILRIPVICSIHANYNRGSVNSDQWIKLWLDRLTMALAAKIVAVSPEIAQKVQRDFSRLKADQIVQISNGIKVGDYELDHCKSAIFTIGHVGRFVPVKNQVLLIQALAKLRDLGYQFRAVIVGYGELEGTLQQLVQELKLLDVVSFIYTTDLGSIYSQMDCFVLPSHQEGLSIALLEAMSFGIVPIVTAQAGHPVIVSGQNGFICSPNDIFELVHVLECLISNLELRQQLGQWARKTVYDNYNLSQVAKRYLELYR